MIIKNVLVVLELKKNLLLVSRFVNDNSCNFEFSNVDYVIKGRFNRNIMMKGNKRGTLYVLEEAHLKTLFSNRNQDASEQVWHWRLRHLQSKVIRFLNKRDFIKVNNWENKSICDSY